MRHGCSGRRRPRLWGPAAVCAGARRPAREIATREPAARSGRSRGPPWPCRHPPAPRPSPATAHGHRSQALRPLLRLHTGRAWGYCLAISHAIPPPLFQRMNLQRWNCNVFRHCEIFAQSNCMQLLRESHLSRHSPAPQPRPSIPSGAPHQWGRLADRRLVTSSRSPTTPTIHTI